MSCSHEESRHVAVSADLLLGSTGTLFALFSSFGKPVSSVFLNKSASGHSHDIDAIISDVLFLVVDYYDTVTIIYLC